MAILSIKGSQPPYCRHALKCEVFAHSRFGKLEEVSAAVASSPPKTVPTSGVVLAVGGARTQI